MTFDDATTLTKRTSEALTPASCGDSAAAGAAGTGPRARGRQSNPTIQAHRVLAALRPLDTVSRLFEQAPAEIIAHCGFDCVAIFRVEGPDLVLVGVKVDGDPALEDQVRRVAHAQRGQLSHGLVETEMLRRGRAALVRDPAATPCAAQAVAMAAATPGYVAAPLVSSSGRAMGFLHADRRPPQRPVGPEDLELVALLGEGLACITERLVLAERLRVERLHVCEMAASLTAVARELCDAEVEMRDGVPLNHVLTQTGIERLPIRHDSTSRLNGLLTRRELEVLALMADGSTNSRIAEQLVIAEATVKSHVKHILRKLRAANRAQAVSRYLRLREEEQDATASNGHPVHTPVVRGRPVRT